MDASLLNGCMASFLTPSRNERSEIGLLVDKSKERLRFLFKEEFEYHHLAVHRSDAYLRRHSGKKIDMFVLFVDLGRSTIMSSDLTPEDFARIIRMFSQEMSYIIENFGGLVLKFVGDAVIGYFPSDGKPSKTATKVACCAYAMNRVICESVNPLLKGEMLPDLQIKISADFGTNNIVRYGSDRVKSHIDVIGLSVNLAAKMQTLGNPGIFVIGETVYRQLPPRLQGCFKRARVDSTKWPYHGIHTTRIYPIFLTKV